MAIHNHELLPVMRRPPRAVWPQSNTDENSNVVLGELDSDGIFAFDLNEPDFTADEIANAIAWQKKVLIHYHGARECQCPHNGCCESISECLEQLAWYFRHRQDIHARLGWVLS